MSQCSSNPTNLIIRDVNFLFTFKHNTILYSTDAASMQAKCFGRAECKQLKTRPMASSGQEGDGPRPSDNEKQGRSNFRLDKCVRVPEYASDVTG